MMDLAVLDLWPNSMILKVFSNLNDSMILKFISSEVEHKLQQHCAKIFIPTHSF